MSTTAERKLTMHSLGQLTTAELRQLIEHTAALTGMRQSLPVELYIKLDIFRADLVTEREERAAAEQRAVFEATQTTNNW
ncbi:MAG TPA: hypothetical protein VKV02_03600 [Acidobacteriaceae bacterium]|nr:hypothetical protein [Acidobacteriaceae bacterium]